MLRTVESQIYNTIKSYIKIYPGFVRLINFDEPIQVREAGWEPDFDDFSDFNNPKKVIRGSLSSRHELESLARSKTKISDIVLCNDFELFTTFTFAKDRQNIDKLKKQMSKHLKNQRERKGKFDYLIIPEFHKDKKSIHFHALFKDYPGTLTPTKLRKHNRLIYNVKDYTLGYSTAVKIQDLEKVSSYIKKYISKDMPTFAGKKRYWCSNGLIRPDKLYNPHLSSDDLSHFTTLFHRNKLTVSEAPATIKLLSNLSGSPLNG